MHSTSRTPAYDSACFAAPDFGQLERAPGTAAPRAEPTPVDLQVGVRLKHARQLAGTPPALVVTVGGDPLCDEGRAYAHRLEEEGVRVSSLHMSDQLHGAALQGRQVPAGALIPDWVGLQLRYALHQAPALS